MTCSTLAITAVTAVVTTIAFLDPTVLAALRRDPAALAAGHWWRLLTPLLVRTDGLIPLVAVLAGTVAAGLPVERLLGWHRELALYLVAGLAGQAAGQAWDPHGAGSSVAMLGLFVGLWVLMLVGPDEAEPAVRVVGAVGLSLVVALVGAALAEGSLAIPALLGGVTGAVALNLVLRTRVALVEPDIAGAALAGGIVLTVLRDNHGPAILAGTCAAFLLWLTGQLRAQTR